VSAGAVGGLLGAGLARVLEGRYGKAVITLGGGLVTIGVALGLALLHLFWLPAISIQDLVPHSAHVDRSSVHGSTLTIWSGGRRFTASAHLGHAELKGRPLTDVLPAGSDVTLWMKPGNESPIGVTLIAIALLAVSLLALSHAAMHASRHGIRGALMAAILTSLAGVIAAEALWSVRPHAFLAFMVWAVCATVAAVLERLGAPGPTHAARLIPDVVYVGLAIGLVAIDLRRAV
jgi:hypothetical protein